MIFSCGPVGVREKPLDAQQGPLDNIQWLDHRIERNTKKTGEVLALDDGQAGDRMYLVQAPKVMKKTRWRFFISSRNYIFCTIKVNRFLAKSLLLVVLFCTAWPGVATPTVRSIGPPSVAALHGSTLQK